MLTTDPQYAWKGKSVVPNIVPYFSDSQRQQTRFLTTKEGYRVRWKAKIQLVLVGSLEQPSGGKVVWGREWGFRASVKDASRLNGQNALPISVFL